MRPCLLRSNPGFVVFMVLLLLAASAAPQTSRPLPPAQVAANQATRQAEKVEPPANPTRTMSADDVLQQADELASLAQQVRADTLQATRGVLAKDMKDKLKRIEKLSKKLREELTP
jgi:hypothetical protein